MFAGLATLDVVHRIATLPDANGKVTATRQDVAAGGPAANAAVAFAALGGQATLITGLGRGPVARIVCEDLASVGVTVIDVLAACRTDAPVSSVGVLESTGERTVIGADATHLAAEPPAAAELDALLTGADVVLVDGHHAELTEGVAQAARAIGRPVVLDAGRWRPVMQALIPLSTDVVASDVFRTPGASSSADAARDALDWGAHAVVTTHGEDPIDFAAADGSGRVEVADVEVVDTLGAGDVFHGAYAFALARGATLPERVEFAARIASERVTHAGPRSWLDAIRRVAAQPMSPTLD